MSKITEFGPDYVWGRLTEASWGHPSSCGPAGKIAEQYKYLLDGSVRTKRLLITKGTSSGMLDSWYGYDNEGLLASEHYPNDQASPYESPYLHYGHDEMGRLKDLFRQRKDIWGNWILPLETLASDGTYRADGGLVSLNYFGYSESRGYNSLGQLTRLQASGPGQPFDEEYRYSATQNNGRIRQSKDWAANEEVTYEYDSLNRLISAVTTGAQWGQSFTYDGFGNLTRQMVTKGTAPDMSLSVSGMTNRITTAGFGYDANGNLTAAPGASYSYDVENRLAVNPATGQAYSYGPDGRRVWDGEAYVFWSATGQPIGRYQPTGTAGSTILFMTLETKVYFGGRLIAEGVGMDLAKTVFTPVVVDRLGSVRVRGNEKHQYWPYGQERTDTAQGRAKFGTYVRDASTLDYADQRYYAWRWGRFMTADPSEAGDPTDPGSWNLYVYVQGDPINFIDPEGLVRCKDMVLDPVGRTLGELLTTATDEGLFALTIFNEGNPASLSWVTGPNFSREQDALAASIWNRYLILNGAIRLSGVPDVSSLGWGPRGASIREVIGHERQYDVIVGGAAGPTLSARAQDTTSRTLAQEQSDGPIGFLYRGQDIRMTPGCFAMWQSYVTTQRTFTGQTADPFRASGFITTSFNSDPSIRVGELESPIGSIGGNAFFGIPVESIAQPGSTRRGRVQRGRGIRRIHVVGRGR